MDLPPRRISSNSPAPPDFSGRASFVSESALAPGSPAQAPLLAPPSAPGTPNSLALPMDPPPTSHSRRSSFGSSRSIRRSVSPAPSLPLPAVMPSTSPNVQAMGVRNANIYANETLTSFFRRLTFAPDGSLLFTPAGQYKTSGSSHPEGNTSAASDLINTVYIYTRAGINKPPIAYLPGHKKPSIAVRCSPIFYTIRQATQPTKQITIDTSSAEDEIPALPEPVVEAKPPTSSTMEPPPLSSAPSPAASGLAAPSPKRGDAESSTPAAGPPPGPTPAFGLPYRIVYAVATQDAIHVYDTQQQKPLCVVSNLHFATFTDLTWYVYS
jgi:chromatin assembly factor 1 subunit B